MAYKKESAAVRDGCHVEEEIAGVVLSAIHEKATEMVVELRERFPDETMRWAVLRQALVIETKTSI